MILQGTFALVILFEDQKDVIYSTRNVSPIVATICKEGAMLASDLTALCRFTNRYFVVPEYHILKLSADKLTLTDFDGNEVLPKYLSFRLLHNLFFHIERIAVLPGAV